MNSYEGVHNKHTSNPLATTGPKSSRRLLEREPACHLNLASGAGSGLDFAHVIGEITCRILEDGVPVTSKAKRTLCITRNAEIRMVEHVIRFNSNRNPSLFSDRKIFVQRRVELRRPRPPQHISSGIAKLAGRRYGKSTWIKPAGWSTHSAPIRTDTRGRVAKKIWTFRSKQRLYIGIVEGERWGKWNATMNVGNR